MTINNMSTFIDPKTQVGFVIRYAYKYDNTGATGSINGEFYNFISGLTIAQQGTLYWDTPHSYWSYTWVPVINGRIATIVDFVDDIKKDNGIWVPDALEKAWLRALNVDSEALSPECGNTFPYIRCSTGLKKVKDELLKNGYYPEAYHFLKIPMSSDCISKMDAIFEKYSKE